MLSVLLLANDLPAQTPAEQDSLDYPAGPAAIPLLREIWAIGRDRIYPPDRAQQFTDSTLQEMEDVLRMDASVALADVLNPFLDGLRVSHTRLYDRRHQTWYMLRSLFSSRDPDAPKYYDFGALLDDRNPGRVRYVLDGSPAWQAGIRKGERIESVDGVPFSSLLQWQHGESVQLVIEAQGTRREVELEPVFRGLHRSLADATVASDRIVECADRRIAYLHLWSGTHDLFLAALENSVARAKREALDGYILDLRDGYGGAWWPYLDPFFPDRDAYFTATVDSRDGSDVMTAQARENSGYWDGPLAVIINGGTRSGKESLAYQFRKTGRATLFGSTTWGAFTGGLGEFTERDANYLLFLSISEAKLDGVTIEGVGVDPDVTVPEQLTRDAPLDAALEHLGCRSGDRI